MSQSALAPAAPVAPLNPASNILRTISTSSPQEASMAKVNAIPKGYHTVTPSVIVDDGARAIDFYKKAFGAQELMRMPGPDGRIMHAEIQIGDSRVMLSDEMPDMDVRSPKAYDGTPVGFYLYIDNVDEAWRRAVGAGAKEVSPLTDMFWGDRTGSLQDPFGHRWNLAQHVADLTPEEIQKGQEAFFAQMQGSR
jgi:PhnB protein